MRLNHVIGPIGIAVAGHNLYWSAPLGHSIGRANLDGRGINPHFINGVGHLLFNPAVVGRYIYWVSEDGPRLWIGRAITNGSHVVRHLLDVTGKITGRLTADALGPGEAPRRAKTQH